MLSSLKRATPEKWLPRTETFESAATTSTLSHVSKLSAMRLCETSSASRRFRSVRPEKTTPHPKVASGGLRSNTVTSCDAERNRINSAKYKPAGPPPMTLILMLRVLVAFLLRVPVKHTNYDFARENSRREPL